MITTLSRRASSTDLSSTAEKCLILNAEDCCITEEGKLMKTRNSIENYTTGWEFSVVFPHSTDLQRHGRGS